MLRFEVDCMVSHSSSNLSFELTWVCLVIGLLTGSYSNRALPVWLDHTYNNHVWATESFLAGSQIDPIVQCHICSLIT